jgi:hypothetical protein
MIMPVKIQNAIGQPDVAGLISHFRKITSEASNFLLI